MGDMREEFDALKKHHKSRKQNNLDIAKSRISELGAIVVHTEWHWKVPLPNGEYVDYWPSTNKWYYRGHKGRGDFEHRSSHLPVT